MRNTYLNLDRAPGLNYRSPECEACEVEAEHDGDDWMCPTCGTAWPGDVMECDWLNAVRYADWSGEKPGGVAVRVEDAWIVARARTVTEQRRLLTRYNIKEWTEDNG